MSHYSTLVTFLLLLISSARTPEAWGQQPAPRVFDSVAIAALNLAAELSDVGYDRLPQPSSTWRELIRTFPDSLFTQDGGKSWWIQSRGRKDAVAVTEFSLSPTDLTYADNVLIDSYFALWIDCMRDAVRGSASAKCISDLASRAEKESNKKVVAILLANLGKRLNTLARRNPEWNEKVFSKDTPPAFAAALRAYRELESSKLAAVKSFVATNQVPTDSVFNFKFLDAVNSRDGTVLWNDFAANNLLASHDDVKMGRPLRAWNVDKNDKKQPVQPIYEPKQFAANANVLTLSLSPDQQIIFGGKFSGAALSDISTIKSWKQLNEITNKHKISAFLSRTGSNEIGVCRRIDPTR